MIRVTIRMTLYEDHNSCMKTIHNFVTFKTISSLYQMLFETFSPLASISCTISLINNIDWYIYSIE